MLYIEFNIFMNVYEYVKTNHFFVFSIKEILGVN